MGMDCNSNQSAVRSQWVQKGCRQTGSNTWPFFGPLFRNANVNPHSGGAHLRSGKADRNTVLFLSPPNGSKNGSAMSRNSQLPNVWWPCSCSLPHNLIRHYLQKPAPTMHTCLQKLISKRLSQIEGTIICTISKFQTVHPYIFVAFMFKFSSSATFCLCIQCGISFSPCPQPLRWICATFCSLFQRTNWNARHYAQK